MTVIVYMFVFGLCLVASGLVAHYSEKIRQAEEAVKNHETTERQLLKELETVKRKTGQLERSIEDLQEEKEKAEVHAQELKIELDNIRSYLKRSLSPRPAHTAGPLNLRAIHA